MSLSSANISKKRKFIADGVFYAELNEFLARTLAEDGYAGVEVRKTPVRTEVIVRATRTREVLGENGTRIRELTALVQKRFGFAEDSLSMYADRVAGTVCLSLGTFHGHLGSYACSWCTCACWLFFEAIGLLSCGVLWSHQVLAARGLSAMAQCESLKFKLLGGVAVRRACYGVVKYVMEAGAKGVEVIVSGKVSSGVRVVLTSNTSRRFVLSALCNSDQA